MVPGGRRVASRLSLCFAGILLIALVPVVLLALVTRDPGFDNATRGTAYMQTAESLPATMPSMIGDAHAVQMTTRASIVSTAVASNAQRWAKTSGLIVTAVGCWLLGVGLTLLLVRSSVVYPLSVLLEVASGAAPDGRRPGPGQTIPEDFDAIRRAVVTMREATETREITHRRTHDNLAHLATSDALTGIGNRRAFDAALLDGWNDAAARDTSLALAFFDIDFFKMFNDRYGHLAGDNCLHEVGQVLRDLRMRDGDLAARLGGEEFALLLRDTDLDGAVTVAERALAAIRVRMIPHEGARGGVVTASVGVTACRPHPGLRPIALFAAADAALYVAKAGGRDRLATGLVLAEPFSIPIRRAS
jgi:diguanylate cyclase (GGDEF)-like protein